MGKAVENLVVGCGLSGATLARCIAENAAERVLIIDRREHPAGNCFDYRAENGTLVHRYGPHAFHTNRKSVWDFLSRFTSWHPYRHRVAALVDEQTIPLPFNLNSLRILFPPETAKRLKDKLLDVFGPESRLGIKELKNSGDRDFLYLHDILYEKIYRGYSLKHWGCDPDRLDPSVLGRLPIYLGFNDDYFPDEYQGVPSDGYTSLVHSLLEHPLIELRLKTSFENDLKFNRLFHTGSVDEFFNYEDGVLPYRSIRFDIVQYDFPYFQQLPQVNYPNQHNYTRTTEYKYFLNRQSDQTFVSFEYPETFVVGRNERDYPIPGESSRRIYERYLERISVLKNVYFLGRLGKYYYCNMDEAVFHALELFERTFERKIDADL